ncbi:hypothetical protein DMH03_13475 [Amycolatopsis sp. WAC 01376]|uniref:hypothetical protein n=1 Tax=Amycolatopsis sp. WAC 01376 TaxID=2203195 RepID=UPI000F786DDF|nr:hypothetical protein [Amycolatopsis sp. WAC 01376]RSM63043.1 hypothetical protein DMH03_13475 [Amycolatopsis sp. WAC 01376]
MREAVRTELLKARSGFWMLFVLAYTLLLPWFAWQITGEGQDMLAYLAVCPVAAAFLGSFVVTRDYYYKSMERAVLMHRRAHVFAAKLIAGAVGGFVAGVAGSVGWGAITAAVDRVDPGAWRAFAGCVAACTLAGGIGAAVGWILPNYYAATSVSLLVPFALELPLSIVAPEVTRFLPASALASIVGAPLPGLSGPVLGSLIGAGWLAVAAFTGWQLFCKREIR